MFSVFIFFSLFSSAVALDSDTKRQLMKLEPRARLEQACDTEAMKHISHDGKAYAADKVIAYTFKDPVVEQNTMTAPGAVFRSKGEWYHLSYQCSTEPEHIEVHALHYEIGGKIPHAEWKQYFLYD
ncbi:DUF930 domain-containing protein [Labrys miyagiensis]